GSATQPKVKQGFFRTTELARQLRIIHPFTLGEKPERTGEKKSIVFHSQRQVFKRLGHDPPFRYAFSTYLSRASLPLVSRSWAVAGSPGPEQRPPFSAPLAALIPEPVVRPC